MELPKPKKNVVVSQQTDTMLDVDCANEQAIQHVMGLSSVATILQDNYELTVIINRCYDIQEVIAYIESINN